MAPSVGTWAAWHSMSSQRKEVYDRPWPNGYRELGSIELTVDRRASVDPM